MELQLPHGTTTHINFPLHGIGLTRRDRCGVLVRLVLRYRDITDEIREGLTKVMRGQEDILGTTSGHTKMQMNLAGWDELGNLKEQGLPSVQNLGALYREDVVPGAFGILHRVLRRTISRTEEIIPTLGEMGRGLASDSRI
jgi:hypothetical protein